MIWFMFLFLHMHRVVIIEDNEPLNDIFRKVIDASDAFEVVGSYFDCVTALKCIQKDSPDVILMDIELPKGIDGIKGTREIKKLLSNVIVIIITVYENSKSVFDALCAGADGYLTKNVKSQKLIASMEEALLGGAPMSTNIAKMVVKSFQRTPNTILTERETEVLTMLAKGVSYKSIAEELFISLNTIKFHVKNIYDKLQVNCKEDAIREASSKKYI